MNGHIEHQHAIVLKGKIDRVFPMFTPLGEKSWIAEWDPEFVSPLSGKTEKGMVFKTGTGAETTYWGCCDWDPENCHVMYSRVTPASRFSFVEVSCAPMSGDATRAVVSYRITALNEDGVRYVSGFDRGAFVEMIESWRVDIDKWLADHPGQTVAH